MPYFLFIELNALLLCNRNIKTTENESTDCPTIVSLS